MNSDKAPVTIAGAVTGIAIAEVEAPPGGGGFTSYDKSGLPIAIGVPASDSDSDLAVRCHEYGHLLLREPQTHLNGAGYPNMTIQAVLDVHTNAWLLGNGVPAVQHLPLHGPGRVRDPNVNLIDRILIAYRSYGLSEPPPVRLPRPLRKRLVRAQRLAANATTLEQLEQACAELNHLLGNPHEVEAPRPPGRPRGRGKGPRPEDEPGDFPARVEPSEPSEPEPDKPGDSDTPPPKKISDADLKRILDRLRARDRARTDDAARKAREQILSNKLPFYGIPWDSENPKFASMQVTRPALHRRLKQARDYGRAARPSYASGPMRYLLRALPRMGDGRIFASVASGHRGTILIDWSGSMNLEASDIEKILAHCPRTQIATYCGRPYENHGELLVLAHHGRIANPRDIRQYGTGNMVDGPALEWLAKQPAPRYWICDGGVTGLEDNASPTLKERCMMFAKDRGIKQFDNLQVFLTRK